MIKNSEFDFSYDYLRFDTTWLFEWDVQNITENTIKFYPFSEQGNSRTWYFRGNNATVKDHNTSVWDPTNPVLEYEANNVDAWDAAHPYNTTRYLSPGSSFVTLTNTIETVVIDNIPPAYVSDRGTEYVWISNIASGKASEFHEARHCEYVFRDEAGLDYKQFGIFIGEPPDADAIENALKQNTPPGEKDPIWKDEFKNLVYYYSRRYDMALINPDYIDSDAPLKIASDGFHTYKIEFNLICATDEGNDTNLNRLNNEGLRIRVYDVAGNHNTYAFGVFGTDKMDSEELKEFHKAYPNYIIRKWILIDSISDITDLDKCVIKFYDAEPKNMIVGENQQGSVWVSIYNPNREFWPLDIIGQLKLHTSIGNIDENTIDKTKMNTEGIIKFKVINIEKHGSVDVEAWVKTGNKLFDDMLITSTYAEASLGPWIVQDADGRKYNLKKYVPNYLKSTDYYQFVEFFELYLNTLYTNLTKGTNISILEKIAKINDFNDIDRIEHALVWHYAKDFGAEYDIDLQTMLDLNLGFYNDGVLNSRTENDVLDILKYALKNLPLYNQIKGSEKGIVMALKMFSFSCRVINLWVKLEHEVEENPDFMEQDRMFDFSSYFLTSRFNIELNSLTVDFPTFNDNIFAFIKFVKSVKPITRILNLIKYTIIFEYDYYWLVNDYIHDDMDGHREGCYRYNITWSVNDIAEMIERSKVNWHVMHADRIWLNYNCTKCITTPMEWQDGKLLPVEPDDGDMADPPDMTSLYTLFTSYIANSNSKMEFAYIDKNLTITEHVRTYEGVSNVVKEEFWHKEGSPVRITYLKHNYNSSGKLIGTETKTVESKPKSTALVFKKRFSLDQVNCEMLDTGFYIFPKTGELATYLAEFVKPTYFAEELLKSFVNQLAEWTADARPSVPPPKNAWFISKVELMDVDNEYHTVIDKYDTDGIGGSNRVVMTEYDIDSNPVMKMTIDHVPGTEIFRAVPIDLAE